MFNLFSKKSTKPDDFHVMTTEEMNRKYNPVYSDDPYVQYALTGSLEHAAKYAKTPAQQKAFAEAKAGEDAFNRIFNTKSSGKNCTVNEKGQHIYEAAKVATDHDSFDAMMRDPDSVLLFK